MTIILIDDNVSTTDLLRDSLDWKAIGIEEVFVAGSASEARELFDRHTIDIIICDIEMPGKSGLALIRELRREGNQSVCIFLTAHAEFDYARQAIELNSFDYILKPFSLETVTQKIQAAARLCREREANKSYIKYGKTWMAQHSFTETEKSRLITSENQEENDAIKKAKKYIRSHYTEELTLQMIADHVFLNPSYLSTLFKQQEALSPIDYLIQIRIDQARILLSSNAFSVSEVALMVGFRNIPYFNRVFKKQTGVTPTAYKKNRML